MIKEICGSLSRIQAILVFSALAAAFSACSTQQPPPPATQMPVAAPTMVSSPLPLFDGHLHYSESGKNRYSIAEALALLDQAGIRRALVSSTPNEGSLQLYEAAPSHFVPEVRPYRNRGDISTWFKDATVIEYLQEELKRGTYRGIGEFHLNGADANTPIVKRMVDLSVEQNLLLHAHSDEVAVLTLFQHNPRATVLWAHAGMSVPVPVLRQMLEKHPNLWIELSYRYDILENGSLDSDWRDLFLRYPDKFVYGSDTWTEDRWSSVPSLASTAREWLAQLPSDIANKIASQNMERLLERGQAK